jgi:hypothetical protein
MRGTLILPNYGVMQFPKKIIAKDTVIDTVPEIVLESRGIATMVRNAIGGYIL